MWFVRSLVHFFTFEHQNLSSSYKNPGGNLRQIWRNSRKAFLRYYAHRNETDGLFFMPLTTIITSKEANKKNVLVWCVHKCTVYYSSVTILSGNVHAAHGTWTPQVVTTVLLRRIGSWEEAFTSPALSATPPRASTVGYRLIWRHKNVHPSLVSPWSACITDQAFQVLL